MHFGSCFKEIMEQDALGLPCIGMTVFNTKINFTGVILNHLTMKKFCNNNQIEENINGLKIYG